MDIVIHLRTKIELEVGTNLVNDATRPVQRIPVVDEVIIGTEPSGGATRHPLLRIGERTDGLTRKPIEKIGEFVGVTCLITLELEQSTVRCQVRAIAFHMAGGTGLPRLTSKCRGGLCRLIR